MADLLSIWSDVGSVGGSPRSSNRVRKHTASFAALDATMISASQDERPTQGCFLEDHEMAAWLYMKTYPDVECRVAQFESEEDLTNSAPAVFAARSRLAVRRTISLACISSRRCCAGSVSSPITLSLSRTGGGPPSCASSQRKKRDTENVEHGGEATMTA
eukprot:6214155-Pleurochrysis_carterae.AAC.3